MFLLPLYKVKLVKRNSKISLASEKVQTCREILCWENIILRKHYVENSLCWENIKLRKHYVEKPLCWENNILRKHYVQKMLCWENMVYKKHYVEKTGLEISNWEVSNWLKSSVRLIEFPTKSCAQVGTPAVRIGNSFTILSSTSCLLYCGHLVFWFIFK